MRKTILVIILMVCMPLILPVNAQNYEDTNTSQEKKIPVIIVFKDKPGMGKATIQSHGHDIISENGGKIKNNLQIINGVAAEIPENALEAISKNKDVAFIEPDYEVYAFSQEVSWGVDRVNAPLVHPYSKGKGIKIAILDTGIDYTHPDIDDNYKGGYDFVNGDNDPMDDHGHGTKVAGVIAAEDNDFGVLGVAPEASIYGLKVLGSSGTGSTSKIIQAIDWAVKNDMDIISMSLGGKSSSYSYEQAVNNAYKSGILIVAAAGNYGSDSPDTVAYPAKYDSVIAVSATKKSNSLASFSSIGPAVELAAPGYYIKTTYPGNTYKSFYGTSAAAPFVSGVAALMMASDPTLTNREIREMLKQNAVDLGDPGKDDKFGYGLVNAEIPTQKTLNADITAGTFVLDSKQSTQITVHVTSDGIPSSGAFVVVTANGGTLSPTSGLTDSNGDISLTYTAPIVTSEKQYTISATVTKTGYTTGYSSKPITVNPIVEPKLETQITTTSQTLVSGANTQTIVQVTDNGIPVTGARVDISASGGSLVPISGVTNSQGKFVTTFTAPEVLVQSQVTISAKVTKDGYLNGSDSTIIYINPLNQGTPSDLPESPHPYQNNYDRTWTITEPGAKQLRIFFSSLKTEAKYDFVYIYDKNDVQIAKYSGYYENIWTPWVDGDTIKVRLKTDGSGIRNGFIVDKKEVVYSSMKLTATLSADSNIIESGKNTGITVHVTTNDGLPISGATVDVSASGGILNPTSGITNSNGDFKATYTAPTVTTQKQYAISTTVSKIGYRSGTNFKLITVNPVSQNLFPQLDTTITPGSNVVQSGKDTQVTIHVSSNGKPVPGANVAVSASNGNLNPLSGITDVNGNLIVTYTAPNVTTQTQVTISVTVTKTGYRSLSRSETITVHHLNPESSVLPESPHPYPNFFDQTWTIIKPGANKIRIHFSDLKTEAKYDFVYIYDGNGVQIARYDGYYENVWTPWVDGDILMVRLTTDKSGIREGFTVDRCEIV